MMSPALESEKWEYGLQSHLQNLRDAADEEAKTAMAETLALEIKRLAAALSTESFAKLTHDLNRRLFEMVHGSSGTDKLVATLLIGRLAKLATDETIGSFPRYANYVRSVLPGKEYTINVAAAQALAALIMAGGQLMARELVEYERGRAIAWLRERSETGMIAAMCVFREIAFSSPHSVLPFIGSLLELVWNCLVSAAKSVQLRTVAIEALRQLVSCILEHGGDDVGVLRRLIETALATAGGSGGGGSNVLVVHTQIGLLAGFKVFVQMCPHQVNAGAGELLQEICEYALKMAASKEAAIKIEAMALVPEAAGLGPSVFAKKYLETWMTLLTEHVNRRDRDYLLAVRALKRTAETMDGEFVPMADRACTSIIGLLTSLTTKSRRIAATDESEIMECIGVMARALKGAFHPSIMPLLPAMLAGEFTRTTRAALLSIVESVPNAMPLIEDRILEYVGGVLETSPDDEAAISFACETLMRFQYCEPLLDAAMGVHLANLLETSPSPKIREAAALALASLIRGGGGGRGGGGRGGGGSEEVLQQPLPHLQPQSQLVESFPSVLRTVTSLMTAAASDENVLVRLAILEAINCASLDFYLSALEPFHILMMILSSGTLPCRLLAIAVVERISRENTGLLFPHFRTMLLQTFADLACPHPERVSEEAALVLAEIVKLNPVLIRPIVEPLLRVLAPRLLDGNAKTATSVIITLTRLVMVNPTAFAGHALDLVDSAAKIFNDQSSSSRRLAALAFLGSLLRNMRGAVPFERLAELLLGTAELLKIELSRPVRSEAIKLMGIIGALDPYKLRSREMELQLSNDSAIANAVTPSTDDLVEDEMPAITAAHGLSTLSEDYYPSMAIGALVKVLRDASQSRLHSACVQALLAVFQSMAVKSSQYLGEVMPILLALLKAGNIENGGISNFVLEMMAALIDTVGLHVRPFASEITTICHELWALGTYHRLAILRVLQSLAEALLGEAVPGLVAFTPLIVSFLYACTESEALVAQLRTLKSMASYARDHVHSIVLAVASVFGAPSINGPVAQEALLLVLELADRADLRLELPLIVPWIRTAIDLSSDGNAVCTLRVADRLACYIYINFAEEFEPLKRQVPVDRLFLLSRLIHGAVGTTAMVSESAALTASMEDLSVNDLVGISRTPALTTTPMGKLAMNDSNLRRSWDSLECRSKEDWFAWIRRLEAELLKESPSPALRACANLAALHYPLARDLFNAAFVACWNELPDLLQDELIGALETALASFSIPPEVLQTILNLAEFMERDDRPLPIDAATLGAYAMKCHAYAKALYYQEAEFMGAPSTESVEALISVASQLGQPDSAVGALVCAQRKYDIRLEESWYEKLQRWDDALAAYTTKWQGDPQSFDSLLGIFRCWHALGDWESLGSLASKVWTEVPPSVQVALVPLAASAAWSEGNWERMSAFVERQPAGTGEGAIFRAVLAIKRQAYAEAQSLVTATRDLLDTELTAMLSESYGRAYNTIVRAHTLSELEEVIQFCQAGHDVERRDAIRDCWSRRLDDCQVSVDVWQRILKIRSLVLPPEDALPRWIKFASLCRRNDRPLLAHKILLMLLRVDESGLETLDLTQAAPPVVYGFLKHNWEIGEREVSVRYMRQYASYLATLLDRQSHGLGSGSWDSTIRLLARCHFKLGEWQKALALDRGEEVGDAEVESYLAATSYDKTWYKAWHGWALINFEMAMSVERRSPKSKATGATGNAATRNPYLVPAIQGFFRSISLSNGNSLQDSLRLLTLWFNYGAIAEVNAAIGDGFHTVPVDNWLQVIPQLIARIHVPSPQVRRLIHNLLADIGRQHPQALIYPLTVASKSQSVSRRTSALAILEKMRSHSARLVEQAVLVSQELIRTAILWEELWYEGLEEASRLYFCDKNYAGMSAILEPLHQLLESGPETTRECIFLDNHGSELKEAREQCLRYKRTGNVADLNAAWEIYHQVFRRISKQLPHIGPINLSTVSPKLLAAKDLEIAIPGSYRAGIPAVRIAAFHPVVGVISSKQRPRKLIVIGSDGHRYKYLLKGHEDLRQDQRVMQLFGLVNTLLTADAETHKRHLTIERFAVIPLSQNTGLIGWAPHCDTMHALIRDYREARGVLLSIEHRLMLQFAPDYDHLPLLNKIEVFEHASANTDGRDLGRVMWHRSLNAESWLERRLAYTRSLAVMSIVGYILGLGDRHPSNLMIDQVSGRVVHIDFGDCFEVAMQRERFPERVPFRLTRMLVRAMEVSGVEGSFRITSEHTMRVLRSNKDSLMAVLEAFVYDPLINWRLLTKAEAANPLRPGNTPVASTNDGGKFPENFSSSRRIRRDAEISRLEDESLNRPEAVNAGALNVINRVSNKLTGRDFETGVVLDAREQVDRLVVEATKVENLCRAYVGWCAFW